MLEVEHASDLIAHIGEKLGPGEWLTVEQSIIDLFADATGDHQWIHVDVERAKTEMPNGRTIAHGYLTLSLLPRLGRSVYSVRKRSRGVNYGSNKVRFISPVPSGSRIRAWQTIKAVEPIAGGYRMTVESTVEIEGQERPALVAEHLTVAYD